MFNDKMIIIYNGNFNPASEVSIDNNEAFEKQIIEKLKQKKDCPSDNPLNFNEKIPLMTQSVSMGLDGGANKVQVELKTINETILSNMYFL